MVITVVAVDGLSRALKATFDEEILLETPTILNWVDSSLNKEKIIVKKSFLQISEDKQIKILNINRLGEIVPTLIEESIEELKWLSPQRAALPDEIPRLSVEIDMERPTDI